MNFINYLVMQKLQYSGSARVPDLPQYILTKLGLNKNLSSLEKKYLRTNWGWKG
uniref:Uncharacterized protein n=1 Tax=Meloidogyne enterolobii TaxID=390850 RepID=A0A6V7Y7P6_MELEN|nr:unnamed protein product [Meloidogyne enterolobii]